MRFWVPEYERVGFYEVRLVVRPGVPWSHGTECSPQNK